MRATLLLLAALAAVSSASQVIITTVTDAEVQCEHRNYQWSFSAEVGGLPRHQQGLVVYTWSATYVPGAVATWNYPDSRSATLTLSGVTCDATFSVTATATLGSAIITPATVTGFRAHDDDGAPTMSLQPSDVTVNCSDIPDIPTIEFPDMCETEICPAEFSETVVDVHAPGSGSNIVQEITRSWYAVDECGNSVEHTQVIVVIDTVAPTIDFAGALHDATFECEADPVPCDVTAYDDCYGELVHDAHIKFTEIKSGGGACLDHTLTRTWRAVDNAGNVAGPFSAVITVEDNTPPVLAGVPSDVNVECDSVPECASVSALDNCEGPIDVTFDEKKHDLACAPHEYFLVRTWTATDSCSHSAQGRQTVWVDDSTPPVLSDIDDVVNAECNTVPEPCVVSATDNCDSDPSISLEVTSVENGCPDAQIITRTWTAEDDCGNDVSETQMVYVTDTQPPVFDILPPATITTSCTSVPTAAVLSAVDACAGSVAVEYSEVYTAGPDDCCAEYTLTRSWFTVDNCGNENEYVQIISVTDTQEPILSMHPGHQNISCEHLAGPFTITATDLCCDNADAPVHYTERRTDGDCEDDYTLIRHWAASDCALNLAEHTQTINVYDDEAPVFDWPGAPPSNGTFNCHTVPPAVQPNVTDNCADPSVTYRQEKTPGSCDDQYTLTRTWTSADDCGNFVDYVQVLEIVDVNPPMIAGHYAASSYECDDVPYFNSTGHGMDNCADVDVTGTVVVIPGSCDQKYELVWYWEGSDDCGNSDDDSRTILIDDTTSPSWNNTVDPLVIVNCTDVPEPPVVAAWDNCDPDPIVTYTETKVPTPCPEEYTLSRQWFVVDDCGNPGTVQTQYVYVQDNVKPEWDFTPDNMTVQCDNIEAPQTPNATDNCGGLVTVTLFSNTTIDSTHPEDCHQREFVWHAKDCKGNSIPYTMTVTVEDNEPPTYSGELEDSTIECTDIISIQDEFSSSNFYPNFTWDDNCDENLNLLSKNVTDPGCPPVIHTFEFDATDDCGNTNHVNWTVTVVDTTPPEFTTEIGADDTVECSNETALAHPPLPSFEDNCSNVYGSQPELEFTYTKSITNSCAYDLIRTYYASDCTGNDAQVSQTLTVIDTTPPVFDNFPALNGYELQSPTNPSESVTYECKQTIPPHEPELTATDLCDQSIPVFFSETKTKLDDCEETLKRTFYAEDDCGNFVERFYIIKIIDTTPPVVDANFDDATMRCNETEWESDIENITYSDTCSDVTYTYTEHNEKLSCENTTFRQWTFADECGNTNSVNQTVTFVDRVRPWFTRTFDHPVAVWDHTTGDAALLDEIDVSTWSEDNCDPDPVETCTKSKISGDCPEMYSVVWECVTFDECGNYGGKINRTIDVDLSVYPELVPPPNLTIECNTSEVTYHQNNPPQVNTTDDDIANLTVSWALGAPEGGCVDRYTVTRTWKYCNHCGHCDEVTQYIFVDDTMDPVVTAYPDYDLECDESDSVLTANVTDNCDNFPTSTYSSTIIHTENCAEKIEVRAWEFFDNCGNSGSDEQTVTTYDDTPPVIQNKPNDETGECGLYTLPSHVLTATDNCDTVDVDYSENRQDHCPYWIIRRWETEDCAGNSDSHSQTTQIFDTKPPVWEVSDPDFQTDPTADPVIKYLMCDHEIPNPPSVGATDICDTDLPVQYSEIIDGSYPNGEYNITRKWRAVDDCGNDIESSMIFIYQCSTPPPNITVDCHDVPDGSDIELVRISIENQTTDQCNTTLDDVIKTPGSCDASYVLMYSFKIACDDQAPQYVYYHVTVIDQHAPTWTTTPLPQNMDANCTHEAQADIDAEDNCAAFANSTGPVDVTPTQTIYDPHPESPQTYYVYNLWTAADACGHSITHTQTITVNDPLPPAFNSTPNETIYAECDAVPPVPHLDAYDECGDVTIDRTDSVVETCPDGYRLVRRWTATDESGKTASTSQTVYVSDTTPPYFDDPIVAPDDLITLECPDTVNSSTAKLLKDNCAEDQYIPVTTTCWGDECTQYTLRTWEGTDDCGNTASMDQTIVVTDTEPPFLLDVPNDTEAPCDGIPAFSLAPYSTDECDSDVEVTKTEEIGSFVSGACEEYDIIRSWVAEDNCGNIDCGAHTISIYDDVPPEMSNIPSARTDECDDIGTYTTPTADDNCDDDVDVLTTMTHVANYDADCVWDVVYDWEAADDCGMEVTASLTLHVVDTTPPYFEGPELGTITESCTHTSPVDQTAKDICDSDVDVTYSETKEDGHCPSNYTIYRVWTAMDCAGNTAVRTQTIEVIDNVDPELVGVPDSCEPVSCDGDTSPPTVTATDNCQVIDDAPDFTEIKIPGDCPQEYKLVRTWTISDDCGNSDEATVTLSVYDEEAPTWTQPSDYTEECDEFDSLPAVNVTDNCDLPLGEETEVDCTGMITSTSGEGCFSMLISCSACDDCGNCDSDTSTLIIDDSTPPEIFNVPGPATNECDDIDGQGTVIANDTCDSDVTVTTSFGRAPNLGFCTETLTYTWTAKDDCGNTETAQQEITIVDTTPPYFDDLPEDKTLECQTSFACNPPTASDICDSDVDVAWTPYYTPGNCTGEYTRTFTFEAEDDCDNTVEHTQTVTFLDTTPPYFLAEPEDFKMEYCNLSDPEFLTGADACDSDPTESAVSTVEISSAPNNTIYHRTWCVTDDCGNDYCFTQTIRVMDNQDPWFNFYPNDKDVECDNIPNPVDVIADDDCDGNLVVEYSETRIEGHCEYNYTLIRSWYAVDSAGNSVSHEQTIEVTDTEAPEFTGSASNDIAECTDPVPPSISASDVCGSETMVVTSEKIVSSCPTEYIIARTWTAVDECGNENFMAQNVSVEDNLDPTILIPADYTAECGEVPICFPGSYNATDDCEGVLDVVFSETIDDTECPCEYTLYRTFEACDCSSNCVSEVQTIVVSDTTPPELHNYPSDVTIGHLSELPPLDGALNGIIVTDNSGMDIQPEVTQTESSGSWTRTFCAEDCSDNSACVTQNIVYIDTTPPNLPEVDDDTVECDEIPEHCDNMDAIGEPDLAVLYSEVKEDISSGQTKYRLIRTWYVQDNSGNSVQEDQTITVVDTTPPLLTRYPVSVTVECDCDTMPVRPTINAIDNCDSVVVKAETQTIANGSPHDYILVWTFNAEDSVGNRVEHVASVTVQDTQAPELALTPAPTAADCDAVPVAIDNYARDNCDPNVNDDDKYDYVQTTIPSGNCPDDYTLVRHWETYDHSAASHYVSHTQTITVTDSTAPTFVASSGHDGCVNADDEGDFGVFDNIEDLYRAASTDDCSPDSQLSITVTGCNSTQVSQSNAFSTDCFYQDSTHKLFVRASRDDDGSDGRVYKLYADIADECGTKTVGVFTFWIPRDTAISNGEGMTCIDSTVTSTYTG